MTLNRKDAVAAALVALAVLAFVATQQAWNVWLIGGSHRWAAGAVGVLGMATCSLGTREKSRATMLLGLLGSAALVLAIVAIVTGSLPVLGALVAVNVALWMLSTVRHALHAPGAPLVT